MWEYYASLQPRADKEGIGPFWRMLCKERRNMAIAMWESRTWHLKISNSQPSDREHNAPEQREIDRLRAEVAKADSTKTPM
jgi:hypothetical protein